MKKGYLRIRNWDKWQSYRRDRGQPPWIKVHREIMRNIEWVGMTDAQRGQLVAIWLLAADHDGAIPASPELVQKLCFMSEPPDLQFFIDQGFIEPDANMTPERRQDDAKTSHQNRDRDRDREETEGEKPLSSSQKREPDRATQLPDNFPAEPELTWAATEEPTVDAKREAAKFCDYWRGIGGAKGRKKDWPATWRNWIRRAAEFHQRDGPKTGDHERVSVIEQAKRMRAVR